MHSIKILFFATLRDKAGVRSMEMKIPSKTTIQELKKRIAKDFPGLSQSMETAVIAINREFAFDDSIIPDSAEVALFPPVSGG